MIDADLGVSGRSTEGRDGFRDLVSRVCLGEVGAVFGLEVSRLARSSADLSRLLELARLTDTLLIDGDGVYDLTDFNDRLLLGLKGTMSEAELHLLAGRLHGREEGRGRPRGAALPLPVGYVRDDDEQIVIDPDEEVAAAVADVFAAFIRDRVGLRGGRGVHRSAFPLPRLWRGVGRSAPVGPADPRPGARDPEQPVLRRRLRLRPLPLRRTRRPGRRHPHGSACELP